MTELLAILLALGAAGCNAGSNVAQRSAARDETQTRSFSLRLVTDLLRRPRWLLGIGLLVLAAGLQATALALGAIAQVEPVLVLELPLTLLLAARVFRRGLSRRDWGLIAAVTVGLVLFLVCLGPESGQPGAVGLRTWLIGLGISVVAAGALVIVGRRRGRDSRAALLGVATGIGFGLVAALFSGVGAAATADGLGGLLGAWQLYAVVVVAVVALFVWQNALQAGQLEAAEPGSALTDPVTSIGWGALAFGETLQTGWWLVGTGAAALLVAAGVVLLARSPALHGGPAAGTRSDGVDPGTAGRSTRDDRS